MEQTEKKGRRKPSPKPKHREMPKKKYQESKMPPQSLALLSCLDAPKKVAGKKIVGRNTGMTAISVPCREDGRA